MMVSMRVYRVSMLFSEVNRPIGFDENRTRVSSILQTNYRNRFKPFKAKCCGSQFVSLIQISNYTCKFRAFVIQVRKDPLTFKQVVGSCIFEQSMSLLHLSRMNAQARTHNKASLRHTRQLGLPGRWLLLTATDRSPCNVRTTHRSLFCCLLVGDDVILYRSGKSECRRHVERQYTQTFIATVKSSPDALNSAALDALRSSDDPVCRESETVAV